MKIKRTTLILILKALALGGFVDFDEIRGQQQLKSQKSLIQKLEVVFVSGIS